MQSFKEKIYEKMLRGESIEIAHLVDRLKNAFPFSEEDKKYIQEIKKNFEEGNIKKYELQISKFSEGVLLIKKDEIFGEETEVYISSLYDDFKNGVDLIVKIPSFSLKNTDQKKEEPQLKKNYQLSALGIDVTFGNHDTLRHKIHYLKNEISTFSPVSIKYLPFKNQNINPEIPHFIIYFPLDHLEKLVDKFNKLKVDFSSPHLNWKEVREAVKDIDLNYLHFGIYNQIFIQTNIWRKKINDKISKTKENISKLQQEIKHLEKKTNNSVEKRKQQKALEIKHKMEAAFINEKNTLLKLETKENAFAFIENYLKQLIDQHSKNEDFQEEKEKIKQTILLINSGFAYNFISEIFYNNQREIEKKEVENLIIANMYLP